jgi:hypothetical protein
MGRIVLSSVDNALVIEALQLLYMRPSSHLTDANLSCNHKDHAFTYYS